MKIVLSLIKNNGLRIKDLKQGTVFSIWGDNTKRLKVRSDISPDAYIYLDTMILTPGTSMRDERVTHIYGTLKVTNDED